MASAEDLEFVANDPVKSIEIDEVPRVIRFYGEEGTILMDDPNDGCHVLYDLKFKVIEGQEPTRTITIDNNFMLEVPVDSFDYTEFTYEGFPHRIKIGAPTRELWLDGRWYSCYFNNLIKVQIGGQLRPLHLSGPPPRVDIGRVARRDLCAGMYSLKYYVLYSECALQ